MHNKQRNMEPITFREVPLNQLCDQRQSWLSSTPCHMNLAFIHIKNRFMLLHIFGTIT